MSNERDLEIAKEYRSKGGVGRLVDGAVGRDEALDPPEADQYWKEFIKPRGDAVITLAYSNTCGEPALKSVRSVGL